MILVGNSRDVEAKRYDDAENVRDAEKRVLIGPKQDAPTFSMRKFTLGEGGFSPYHSHPWEHEVYVLDGHGEVRFAGGSRPVEPGDFVLVPPNDEHQFANTGSGALTFLCMVPLEGEDG